MVDVQRNTALIWITSTTPTRRPSEAIARSLDGMVRYGMFRGRIRGRPEVLVGTPAMSRWRAPTEFDSWH
jgi:hypothetical protein